jgi:hypothetical protein
MIDLRKDSGISIGDIVQHFKREMIEDKSSNQYLYVVKDIAQHTETGETLVIYQALYYPFKTFARPYNMFISKVDKEKYPNIKQQYRLQKIELEG